MPSQLSVPESMVQFPCARGNMGDPNRATSPILGTCPSDQFPVVFQLPATPSIQILVEGSQRCSSHSKLGRYDLESFERRRPRIGLSRRVWILPSEQDIMSSDS